MRFGQAREAYVRWLFATRDLSPHTLRAYQGDLSSFEASVGTETLVDELDRSALVGFLETQRASGLSPASLRRRASALRGFSRWLLAQGLIGNDPWIGASVAAERGRRLPRVLPPAELDRLLAFLKRTAGMSSGPTHAQLVEYRPHESTTLLAVTLMVATGVRVHEVVGFRHQDVDLSGRAIRLVGKGRRERQVFLTNDWITGLTESYLQARAKLDLPHSRLLFNLHYEPLTTAAMRSRLRQGRHRRRYRSAGDTTHAAPYRGHTTHRGRRGHSLHPAPTWPREP